MIVFAHALDWLEPALFAAPAAIVVAAIFRTRRSYANRSPEEATR